MSMRDLVNKIAPTWLQTGNNEKVLYTIGLLADALIDKLDQAILAFFPGKGTTTALPYIGADRQIEQGLIETVQAYAVRLSRAFDTWRRAGAPRGKLEQIGGYLSGFTLRMLQVSTSIDPFTNQTASVWNVYAAGADVTAAPSHSIVEPSNWRWDYLTDRWFRAWPILDALVAPLWASQSRKWGDGTWTWGDPRYSWGFDQPSGVFSSIRSLVGKWKAAHASVEWIVVNFAAGQFDPTKPFGDASLPDANWKNWSKIVATGPGGSPVRVPSRSATARYISGP